MVGLFNNVEDPFPVIYDFGKVGDSRNNSLLTNQLFMRSDRVIIDSKTDDIFLTSFKDIYIGAGENLSISTNKNFVIESKNIYLGSNKKLSNGSYQPRENMEQMVLGNRLLETLQELISTLKEANSLFYGSPLPLVDSTAAPLVSKFIPIEQKLNEILSQYHYIEPNGEKT